MLGFLFPVDFVITVHIMDCMSYFGDADRKFSINNFGFFRNDFMAYFIRCSLFSL